MLRSKHHSRPPNAAASNDIFPSITQVPALNLSPPVELPNAKKGSQTGVAHSEIGSKNIAAPALCFCSCITSARCGIPSRHTAAQRVLPDPPLRVVLGLRILNHCVFGPYPSSILFATMPSRSSLQTALKSGRPSPMKGSVFSRPYRSTTLSSPLRSFRAAFSLFYGTMILAGRRKVNE
jgi:hypothetical protein